MMKFRNNIIRKFHGIRGETTSILLILSIYYWCCSLSKSLTVLTGLKVPMGTSTKMVFQLLMAPFQSGKFERLQLLAVLAL